MNDQSSPMSNSATIKDVAQRAGVSISTVSRVFNGLDRVSDSTREKVWLAVGELNYVPSSIAASMITGRTHVVLIIVPDIINSFFSTVVQGAENYFRQNGYYAMVLTMGEDESASYDTIYQKFSKVIDGIIVIPAKNDLSPYRRWGKPYVVVDRYTLGSGMNAVVANNRLGANRLTRELLCANHRKIAIIIGPRKLNITEERLTGFLDALREYGIEPRKDYIRCESFESESGYKHTKSLLQLDDPPTAIFAGNNQICCGCIQALQEMGKTFGTDLSFVSFDNHLLAQYLLPGITVIEQPALAMGRCAAQRLLDIINGVEVEEGSNEIVLPVHLIRRGSVVPIP